MVVVSTRSQTHIREGYIGEEFMDIPSDSSSFLLEAWYWRGLHMGIPLDSSDIY
jgi:hypothetical protein